MPPRHDHDHDHDPRGLPPLPRDATPPLSTNPRLTFHRPHSSLTSDSEYRPVPSPPALSTYYADSSRAQHSRTVSASAVPPVRRKPLPQTASPLAIRFSPVEEKDEQDIPKAWPTSHTSNLVQPAAADIAAPLRKQPNYPPPSQNSNAFAVRDLDRYHQAHTPTATPLIQAEHVATDSHHLSHDKNTHRPLASAGSGSQTPTRLSHVRLASDSAVSQSSTNSSSISALPGLERSDTMSLPLSSKSPNLPLHLDVDPTFTPQQSDDSQSTKPKSPSKFGAFFGWKSTSPGPTSPATSFTSRTPSPLPSPISPHSADPDGPTRANTFPTSINTFKANQDHLAPTSTDSGLSIPGSPAGPVRVDEMEDELRQISSELASSIRREMDLEDLVEKLQAEVATQPGGGRRTSDYFSDSGNSSVRALSESETKQEEMEKSQRRMEQEKAQLRLELTQKVQEERSKRKDMEVHVQGLQEKVQRVDLAQLNSSDASGRVKELEASLEDMKRKLVEERLIKDNFQDLFGALQGQIEEHRNERDNLKDEVVPQLRARVEGLESEAAELQLLAYENTRMQQELQTLKNENNTLVSARRMQVDLQQQGSRIGSIQEDDGTRPGLSRSNSTARSSLTGKRTAGLTLGRSSSVTQKDRESRESLADRVKDIEAQRDALHSALKSLLERQDFQNRENDKRIRALEVERDHALSGSPRRMGYDREVTNLREEINTLRRRADEALEQKWQCEKGLAGIKMDLDRAEQETGALRTLLQEHDILVPEAAAVNNSGPEIQVNGVITSSSLEKAYKELQSTHARSVARIKELERKGGTSAGASRTMQELQRSMDNAEAQRESAQKEADEYRLQAESYQQSNATQLSEEQNLAEQLRSSASRVEELARQVQRQLASNDHLRKRLAEAIGRGEREQKASAVKITDMQRRLKAMEDLLLAAQQQSEDSIAAHEDEVRELKDSHSLQLQRMKNGFKTAHKSKTPASPLFSGRTPKLDKTTSGDGVSMAEATKTEELESRVKELEKALRTADREMEEVVSRMNKAQIEVMELQTERDEAMRTTRRLHGTIDSERSRVQALMA
ncbi:MAG: hypothetical protein M1814_002366 [Vezdaea aestivalis]|nr:MAG: hypothetical protein M1814_002366 [Vezdaea aestivalis]